MAARREMKIQTLTRNWQKISWMTKFDSNEYVFIDD